MKINIAVCGKFHLLNYVMLDCFRDEYQAFYFSARKKNLSPKFFNAPLKEWLVQAHGQFPGKVYYDQALPIYMSLWERSALEKWKRADLLHLVSHGAGLKLINKAKPGKVLLEVVNTHPENRLRIIQEQAEFFGIRYRETLSRREKNVILEAEESEYLLAPSKIVAKSYSDKVDSKRIFVLPYAANVVRFQPKAVSESSLAKRKLKIVCVGQIGLRKGQLHLLGAIRKISHEIELTLVGDVDSEVRKIVKKYENKFTHVRRVESEAMPRFLRKFDILILPSMEEGLAVSMLEAMASGLCVIASRASGAEEFIQHRINGIVLDSVTSGTIAASIEELCARRDLVAEFSRNGIEHVQTSQNWGSYALKLKSIYRRYLEN